MIASFGTAYGPGMRCAIVVLTHNEADTISGLLDELVAVAPVGPGDPQVDVLVVDDSSSDGTGDIVQAHPDFGGRTQLLTRTAKDGLGAAYRAGFSAAVTVGYDVVVQMDADGSHPAAEIPAMLAQLGAHDLVIGSRYIAGDRTRNWPVRRRALSWGANLYARSVLRSRRTTASAATSGSPRVEVGGRR